MKKKKKAKIGIITASDRLVGRFLANSNQSVTVIFLVELERWLTFCRGICTTKKHLLRFTFKTYILLLDIQNNSTDTSL